MKIFKKASAILVVLLLVLQVFVPATAAGQTYYCSVCHENGVLGAEQHRIAPTCGEDGYIIYACNYKKDNKDCAGTITIKVNATGVHVGDGNVVDPVAPTCTEDGNVAYETCTTCDAKLDPTTGRELATIVDPATGHDYVETVTPPTCTEDGFTTYVCSVCGDTYTDDEVKAHGHSFTVDVVAKAPTCREEGYTAHKKCEFCDEIDPENPKTVIPVEDHNGKIIDHKDRTCTVDGYNIFKCEKETCPYYNGVKEVLKKLGHNNKSVAAKAATCTEDGWKAHVECQRCDYTTKVVIPALGHTMVNKGFVAPTCVKDGMTDAVVCDRCNFVHHAGEIIPATGHDLYAVTAKEPTCTATGRIAHTKCRTCNKTYAADSVSGDPAAVAVSPTLKALGHDYHEWIDQPTCTEVGYKIKTCVRPLANGGECEFTVSEEIKANGHTFEFVEKVDPKCEVEGKEAHNKCTVCQNLYAADVKESDIETLPVTDADLVIEALEHVAEPVTAVNPTYNAGGNTAGEICKLCGVGLNGTVYIDELDEAVKFYYNIAGVAGSKTAVNSGYVKVEVYFDVLADIDDLEEYNSDVLANLFAVDFAMNYDSNVFTLTHVEVAPGLFAKAEFTPFEIANAYGVVAIAQDMAKDYKVFRGTNLFATLTFQVSTDAPVGDYSFDTSFLNLVHPEDEIVDTSASEMSETIYVAGLGDANGDSIFTSADTFIVSKYIVDTNVEKEYVAEYDMNKDGKIDFIDLDLVRKAIVGNDEFLGIIVDPNQSAEIIVPEE